MPWQHLSGQAHLVSAQLLTSRLGPCPPDRAVTSNLLSLVFQLFQMLPLGSLQPAHHHYMSPIIALLVVPFSLKAALLQATEPRPRSHSLPALLGAGAASYCPTIPPGF